MPNKKIIKEMYLFFGFLYETLEQIGEETLSEWSHKETPEKVYCVIDESDKNEKQLDTQWAWVHRTLEEAEEELKEWNEL